MIKCGCGGSYLEGSIRHFNSSKHIKYLEQMERENKLYNEIISMLCLNKFGGADRFSKAKKFVEEREVDFKDRLDGLKALLRELKDMNASLIEP